MNIILTGPRHCGKSTLLSKFLSQYNGFISGFITHFDNRSSVNRRLLIRSVDGSKESCVVRWSDGSYTVDFDIFDSFAPTLIELHSELIVFDELGKFEASCLNLKAAVESAFSSSADVIAVIRSDAPSWIGELKKRSDAMVINVNENNRDRLPDELKTLISSC